MFSHVNKSGAEVTWLCNGRGARAESDRYQVMDTGGLEYAIWTESKRKGKTRKSRKRWMGLMFTDGKNW